MKMLLVTIFLASFVLVEPQETGCYTKGEYKWSYSRRPRFSSYDYDYNYDDDDDNYKSNNYILMCEIFLLENENSLLTSSKNVPKTDITSLDFSGSKFSKVPSDIFSKYTNAQKIILTDVNLLEIEQGAFKGMLKLNDLQLNYNNITTIKEGTLSNLTNLTKLNLSFNKLQSSSELKKLITLEELNLKNNQFRNLNDIYTESLEELDLSHNNLSVLDKPIIMKEISLSEFTYLDLSFNQIEKIPEDIFPVEIIHINLAYNKIHNISFINLCGIVNVSHNQISALSNFEYCLQSLDISHNKITVIPKTTFENGTLIEYLNFGYNNITNLHVDTFNGTSYLYSLHLNHNNISKIDVGTFHNLNHLTVLNLSYNNIETISLGTFSGLHNLEELDLSGNKLKILMPGSLINLFDLKFLYLDNNCVQDFDIMFTTKHMQDLEKITLDNNQITCDWLATVLRTLKSLHSLTLKGNTFKVHNINGIRCAESSNIKTEIIKLRETEPPVTQGAEIEIPLRSIVPPINSLPQPLIYSSKSVMQNSDYKNSNISQINQEQIQNIMRSVSHLYYLTLIIILSLIIFICIAILYKYRKYVFKRKISVETIQLMDSLG